MSYIAYRVLGSREKIFLTTDFYYNTSNCKIDLKSKIKGATTDFWNFCREVNIELSIQKTFHVTSANSDLEIKIDGHKLKQNK